MKQRVYRALHELGVPGLLGRLRPGRLTIVMYHGFTARTRGADLVNYEGLHLHVDDFRDQLAYLRDHHVVIPLAEAVEAIERGISLPPRAAVITMDDGYRSNHDLALPLLREFGMPATIFLATDFVDRHAHLWTDRVEFAIDRAAPDALATLTGAGPGPFDTVDARGRLLRATKRRLKQVPQEARAALVEEIETRLGHALATASDVPPEYEPLLWEQVEALWRSDLVSIGSHSRSHFILARCSDERIVHEIHGARAMIEERTGRACPLFAYPNGQSTDYDHRTRRAVIDAGHTCALTTVVGFNDLRSDRYELRRVGTMNEDTLEDFAMAMCGVSGWLSSARRRLGAGGTRTPYGEASTSP